jgi:apolipoprotein N-acyltransferase
MSKKKLILLSLLSGILMTLAWVKVMSFGFIMLVAFIPLLFMEDYIAHNNKDKRFCSTFAFIYSYPAFFIFTFVNTWWISNASPIGYIVPVAEAAFMSIVFQLYSYTKKVAKQRQGAYFFIIFYWLTFEYIQYNWDINFPWLNLGNSFASYPILIQWYSVLGMEGGTLWILLSNILIYLCILSLRTNHNSQVSTPKPSFFHRYKYVLFAILILVVPITWSIVLWNTYKDDSSSLSKVLVVQPNLDPYTEQYVLSPQEVIYRVENIASPYMGKDIDFLVLPESCIQEYAWEDLLLDTWSIQELTKFNQKTTDCQIIAGISSRKLLPEGIKTEAAREVNNMKGRYFESCNTALMFNSAVSLSDIQLRHKSVLVVGVEKLPFKKYLPFVENLALNMGGTVGTLGTDASATNFYEKKKNIQVGVPICWESIDGEYTRQFVNNGANFLQIITNVGWWGDTPGYKQYFAISRLRAIENRRYVSICANTGISGLINAKGQVLTKSKYWTQDALKYDVPNLHQKTFFSSHGDMFMRPFSFFSVLLLAYTIIRNRIEKKLNKKKTINA